VSVHQLSDRLAFQGFYRLCRSFPPSFILYKSDARDFLQRVIFAGQFLA